VTFEEEPWKAVSNTAKDFILKLLKKDPTKRLTAQQVRFAFLDLVVVVVVVVVVVAAVEWVVLRLLTLRAVCMTRANPFAGRTNVQEGHNMHERDVACVLENANQSLLVSLDIRCQGFP